jgi:5-(aminomethyl)-3-furanmethanol phosphate kinase
LEVTVIKVGGSLARQPQRLRALCSKLCELSGKHSLVVVPGGGEFADTVRQLDKRFTMSNQASHKMAVLGMDQYGWLLLDLMTTAVASSCLQETKTALYDRKLVVFLPAQLMQKEDPLENSWTVTSDSIALYIAHMLHAKRLLLATDVDGIYGEDPKHNPQALLIEELSAQQLLTMDRTSVDAALAGLLLKWKLDCFVLNGAYPLRVESLLGDQKTVCTHIKN